MKTNIAIMAVLLFLSMDYTRAQHEATIEDAISVAINELLWETPIPKARPIQVHRYEENGKVLMYEVETTTRQSVLVSGSKACSPILAVYETRQTPWVQAMDSMSCGVQVFMDRYRSQLRRCFQENGMNAKPENIAAWNALMAGPPSYTKSEDAVAPLLKSRWGQDCSNSSTCGEERYAYNCKIPSRWYHGDCDHPKAGCTAVAIGQLMYYYNYPIVFEREIKQFDWCKMADELNLCSPSYYEERDAVAHLLADCAEEVTISFGFGCNGTSGTLINARNALVDRYGYSDDAELVAQDNHSSTWWKGELKKNLDNGHPVPYAGAKTSYGTKAHAFVCDGYRGDLFHFNWGWNGGGHNIYCNIDNIYSDKKDTTDIYDYWLFAIFNVYPASEQDICDMHMNLSVYYALYPNHILFGVPAWLLTPRTMTTLTSASASSPAAWRTIPAGASAEYVAHEEVILEDGFEAEWGSEFEAWIEPCAKCGENRADGSATRTLTQREDSLASDSTEATYMASGHSEFTIHNSEFKIGLFPNPTDGPLAMETDGEAESVVVYDAKGLPVGGWRLVGRSGRSLQLDVAALRPGAYILSVRTAAGTSIARFVRR